MLFTNTKYRSFAKDPAVARYNGQYFLYHTILYPDQKIGIGIAVSSDLENWELAGEVPITQECEQNGIGAPAAFVSRDNVLHLFYQTYGNGKNDAICHASSADGLHFEKDETNPVFHPDDNWCCGRAIDADICYYKNHVWMFYATRDHACRTQKIGCALSYSKSDFSRNKWHQGAEHALLTPELKWEGDCIEAPAVIASGNELFMFYGGSYNCSPQQIGCAVSTDAVHFDRIWTKPFLPCGAEGSWNSCESGHPYVFRDDDGRVYLFYQGTSDKGKTWYISKQEITFNANNRPVLVP